MNPHVHRKRDVQVAFRCTQEEADLIAQKVAESKMSRTEYLINTLQDKEIITYPGLLDVMTELKRQGNNLNQALRHTHSNPIFRNDLRSAIQNCNKLYSRCLRLWIEIRCNQDFKLEQYAANEQGVKYQGGNDGG